MSEHIREGYVTYPCCRITTQLDFRTGEKLPTVAEVPNTNGERIRFRVYIPDMFGKKRDGVTLGTYKTCMARGSVAESIKAMHLRPGSRVAINGMLVTERPEEGTKERVSIEVQGIAFMQK